MKMNLTIIIPTLNRSKLLISLLEYYKYVDFKGQIIISDASNISEYNATNNYIYSNEISLNVKHHYLPKSTVYEAVAQSTIYVKTDYVCLIGDDDFIIPNTAQKCIDFLKINPDYVAVHGLGILLTCSDLNTNKFDIANFYYQTIREEDSANERLRAHLDSYSVSLFSVHRIDAWRKMFSISDLGYRASDCDDKTFFAEILPCCMSIVLGKVGHIDGLYLVRLIHPKRYILPNWFTWLTQKNWLSSYMNFRSVLAKNIYDIDKLNKENILLTIDNAFSIYLRNNICQKNHSISILKNYFRKFTFLKSLYRFLCLIFFKKSKDEHSISFIGLQRASSPFYQDFKNVLDVINK